ncbi:MAG: metallophosphoesterase [Solibacillus sp.]
MRLFVISDIHGMFTPFEQLLSYWQPEDKLVLLGDLVDRGPQSLAVIQRAMQLRETYGDRVVYCMGNHDKMLLDFIASPFVQRVLYFQNGGRKTMQSFLKDASAEVKELNAIEQAYYVQQHFAEELAFLASGKLYDIIGNVLLTHAGFDSSSNDLAHSTDNDFLWIREHYQRPNQTPYVNVFGHTPTILIHKMDDVWISEDRTYIGIDGGCAFGGQLNAVLLTEQGEIIETYFVKGEV